MDSFIPAGLDTDELSHHTEKEEHLHLRWTRPTEHFGHQTQLDWCRCETELWLQAVELISVDTRSVECLFSASLHLVCNWLGRTCHLYQSKVCAHLTVNKRAETHWCLAFSHIFQCTGSPGVFCFVFFVHDDIWIGFSTEVKDLILLCAPSYFCFLLNFTWLKSCRCCFSNHALFACALMQCVGWECADVYRGLRCEISWESLLCLTGLEPSWTKPLFAGLPSLL